MSETRASLRQRLLQSQQAVLEQASVLDEAAGQIPVNAGWSVQDLLAHLASAELGHCQVVRRLLDGEATVVADFDLDAFNETEVTARRGLSLLELRAEYHANRAATLALLETVGEEDWTKAGPHPGGFDTTVEGVFRVITIHEKRHLREWQAALATEERPKSLLRGGGAS